MEPGSEAKAELQQMTQVNQLEKKMESSMPVNPESEQAQAREKMGALMDRLDQEVGEKGVIAQVIGTKDENGDRRAAILTEPVIQGEGDKRSVGYVVLTPDGGMMADASDKITNANMLISIMGNPSVEDYPRQREYLKGLNYKTERTNYGMTYRLEGTIGMDPATIYLRRPELSKMQGVDIEAQFDKSVANAIKPLEGAKDNAARTIELADSLGSKF